ncbi:cystinosin homolog [Planococcus citri]|uniref:cystinosin homolog n=1 Tax=Planococcus citri TaxID=170843 RepID=UPI0031F97C09
MSRNLVWHLIFNSAILSCALGSLQFDPDIVKPLTTKCEIVRLSTNTQFPKNTTIDFDVESPRIAHVSPESIVVNNNSEWSLEVCAKEPGSTVVLTKVNGFQLLEDEAVLHITVGKIRFLIILAVVVGWIYFTACTISFYPQIYENYVRQSVVGLNFDYCALNIVGFFSYSLYNMGMLYISFIEKEYFKRHPTGLNPVQVNDLLFSTHGTFASVLTMIQCYIYERSDQRISWTARLILSSFGLVILTSGITASLGVIHWLDFLYYCSYIKLCVTIIKYVPQALMNYRRKSTVGWSIFNVILDFNGAFFSVSQMLINAYNYDDWESIMGDPTKFGLGSVSLGFDILFCYQHYVLYRHSNSDTNIISDTKVP